MFNQEKVASLLSGSQLGSAVVVPEVLTSHAMAGLLRVVRAYPDDFIEVGLMEYLPVLNDATSPSTEAFHLAARGHYKLHPIAVALGMLSVSSSNAGMDQVVGHFVLGCLSSASANNVEFVAAEYSACLALRKLMDMSSPDLLFAVFPADGRLNLDDHQERLAEWKYRETSESSSIVWLRRVIEDLERFHKFLADKRHPQPGRKRSKTVHQSTTTENSNAEYGLTPNATSLEKPLKLPPEQAAVRPAAPGPESQQSHVDSSHTRVFDTPRPILWAERVSQAARLGEPVTEGVDRFEVTNDDESSSTGQSFTLPRQRLPQGHFQVSARRTAAQDLALANPATLRPTDIELLISSLGTGGHSMAIKAVVAAALFGGQPATRMVQWEVMPSIHEMELATSKSILVLKPFGLLVPLEATKVLPRAPDGEPATMAPAVFLPLNLEWRGVRVLYVYAATRVGQRLFTPEEIASASCMIRQIGELQTTALTLRRLCAFLPRRIRDSSEDIVIKALVTGDTLSLSASSRLHYVQTTVKKVAGLYWEQATKLHHELGGSVACNSLPVLPFDGTIGSQRCPQETALQAWIGNLCGRVGTPPRGRPTRVSVANFHNLYSAYVVENLAWASGVRPHRKGMAGLEPVASTLFIDEKERGVAALRQVPLCPQALTQWDHYKTHREWVIGYFKQRKCPLFFSINENGRVSPLTFARVRNLTEHPFEPNANRHYFSTSLRRAGLSGDEVNVLMGHAILGEETGNRYNALDPRELRIKAVNAIQAWMTRDGWMAREGFGRG